MIAVQEAVAVVVGKGGHDRGVLHVEAVFVGAFGEGAVAVVDEEQIGGVVTADVDVRPAVLIDVHHSCADLRCGGAGAIDACGGGDVGEFEGGCLPVQRARAVPRDNKNVEQAVAVKIGDSNARFDGSEGELAEAAAPQAGVVVEIRCRDARLLRRELLENPLACAW